VVLPPKADPPPADIQLIFMYYLYIIESTIKKWHYIGITEDIEKRLKEHNYGKTVSTKPYKPFRVIHTETFPNKTLARKREIHLKKNFKAREEIFKNLNYGAII
jgi:putative endonuclease